MPNSDAAMPEWLMTISGLRPHWSTTTVAATVPKMFTMPVKVIGNPLTSRMGPCKNRRCTSRRGAPTDENGAQDGGVQPSRCKYVGREVDDGVNTWSSQQTSMSCLFERNCGLLETEVAQPLRTTELLRERHANAEHQHSGVAATEDLPPGYLLRSLWRIIQSSALKLAVYPSTSVLLLQTQSARKPVASHRSRCSTAVILIIGQQ